MMMMMMRRSRKCFELIDILGEDGEESSRMSEVMVEWIEVGGRTRLAKKCSKDLNVSEIVWEMGSARDWKVVRE